VSGSVDDVIARDDIDAVYISTINELHRTHTEAAAAAGKHVLCEKPLALTVEDGRAMLEACERAGVTLATNHHLPGSGIHRTIRRLVADGAVGRVLAVRVFHAVMLPAHLQGGWRLESRTGGGVAMDITCHDASVLNPLLGALPTDVVALAAKQGPWGAAAEDALMSTMRYADGALVQTHDAFTIAYAPTGLHVLGSDGSIEAAEAMVQDPVGTILLRDPRGEREVEPDDRRDLYEINVAAFVAALRGEGAPTATGVDGLRAVQVALAVREAAGSGRNVSVTA
jgi:1,5-anhydro-D-fructose reductase (1,5-anhydro-D-mannitol-forming)